MDVIEYSLWLVPTGETFSYLSGLIKKLASKYNSVPFMPHVTLIGARLPMIDMILKTEKLVRTTVPFTIRLKEVTYLHEFYRCLFVKAEESKELLDFNTKTKELFGKENDLPYMPHLSLLYGHYPEEVKKEILKDIGSEFDISFQVSLITMNEFVNVETMDAVLNWRVVKRFRLGE